MANQILNLNKPEVNMRVEDVEKAREFLKALELKTRRSDVPFARRALYAQEFLAETKKQIEITA
jgi:hypothetical protein